MARWAEYLEQLFKVDPQSKHLQSAGLQTLDADPPIDETATSTDDVKDDVAKFRDGKAAWYLKPQPLQDHVGPLV